MRICASSYRINFPRSSNLSVLYIIPSTSAPAALTTIDLMHWNSIEFLLFTHFHPARSEFCLNASSTTLFSGNPCLCTAKAGLLNSRFYLMASYTNGNSRKNLAGKWFPGIFCLKGYVQIRNSANSLSDSCTQKPRQNQGQLCVCNCKISSLVATLRC